MKKILLIMAIAMTSVVVAPLSYATKTKDNRDNRQDARKDGRDAKKEAKAESKASK